MEKKHDPERVLRGSSWGRDQDYCRAADRGSSIPGLRNGSVGFRLVRKGGCNGKET